MKAIYNWWERMTYFFKKKKITFAVLSQLQRLRSVV